jgi:glycosyltransferase involved in cell wall biosynthesis
MNTYINARFLTQPLTGVQRYAVELSLRLKEMDSPVRFLCPKNVIHHDLFKKLDAKVIGRTTGHLWEQMTLPLHLKNSDLLVNFCNTAPLFHKNQVVTIHDIGFNVYPQSHPTGFVLFYKFLFSRIMKSSKHIITVSNFSKQEITRHYRVTNEKVSVVYSAPRKYFQPESCQELQKEKYFLAVSSLNYRKNIPALLKAFSQLSNQERQYRLYLIGDMRAKSFKKLDLGKFLDNPYITFLGRVSDEDLRRYYSNAVGFVYPSLYEGLGLPPLEAQRCSCPVLVSNVASLPEVFRDSAVYCNPFSVDSIRLGMLKLADEDTRQVLIAKGTGTVKRFLWEKNAEEFFNLFKRFHSSNIHNR